MIEGIVIKSIVSHSDERQTFREIIRVTDSFFGEGFGQFSHAIMLPSTAKGWHIHKTQVDWWYVPIGALVLALHDKRVGSPTFGQTQEILMGDIYPPIVVKIPPGVAHGCRVTGGVTHLFYITSSVYNPAEEGRIPHDDPSIGYNYRKFPDVK